jgi:4'-phosphopantetheinyl transferase
MKELYFLELETPAAGSVLDLMFLSLPENRKNRLLRYRHDIDRKIGICADVLLRCLICRASGVRFMDIELKTGPAGKPYLSGGPGCEFNISHTRNAVAAALSDGPVGVDVEGLRDIDAALAERVFSDNELALFRGAEDRTVCFFDIWTKKEALLKYGGQGLSGDLKACDVTRPPEGAVISTFRCGGYTISACAKTPFGVSDLKKVTEADLAGMWRDSMKYLN